MKALEAEFKPTTSFVHCFCLSIKQLYSLLAAYPSQVGALITPSKIRGATKCPSLPRISFHTRAITVTNIPHWA
jgi:hypothetical protein